MDYVSNPNGMKKPMKRPGVAGKGVAVGIILAILIASVFLLIDDITAKTSFDSFSSEHPHVMGMVTSCTNNDENTGHYDIVAKYEVNGKSYSSLFNNVRYEVKQGESINVWYNESYPDNAMIEPKTNIMGFALVMCIFLPIEVLLVILSVKAIKKRKMLDESYFGVHNTGAYDYQPMPQSYNSGNPYQQSGYPQPPYAQNGYQQTQNVQQNTEEHIYQRPQKPQQEDDGHAEGLSFWTPDGE